MKSVRHAIVCGLMLGAVIAFAISPVDAAAQHKRPKKRPPVVVVTGAPVAVQVVFSPGEVQVLREYYTSRYQNLPPGLQKKLHRTGKLPPGWQKKFEPFPPALERRLGVLPAGYRRGVIDGHAVIYNRRMQTIIDVAVLF